MSKVAINYFRELQQIDSRCRCFLFLYFIRAISAGIAYFIGIYLAHIQMKWLIIGYEVTALSAGYLIGAWLAAQLSDKFNPLLCSGYSLLMQGICFLIIAHSNLPWLLGFAVFFYGISGYFYIAVNHYIITSYAGASELKRAQVISFSSVASNMGLLIGGVVVSYLSKAYAPLVFTIMGLALIAASCVYFMKKSDSITIKNANVTDRNESNPLFYNTAILVTFLLGCIFAQQRIGYQIFLEEHFDGNQISLILGLNTFLIVLFLPYLTHRLMQFNRLITMGWGSMLLGAGMFMTILSSNYFFILILCLIRTIGEMIATVLSQYICFQYSPKTARGKAMGQHKFIFALGILIGSFVGSKLLVNKGVNVVWDFCGTLGLICLAVCIIVSFLNKKNLVSVVQQEIS